ncbi:hypothetical protein CBU03nite_41190 [Clostridium butyricum]|nr:hypothetical protein [Clostridium butyricum]MBZ5747008.1 hypothetical protein [Clostridium butyricum]BBK75869.1 hypothetical protein Cbu04g_08770 [Clostridium butyricum]GEQ27696.1 hypothetical protein CBU03nite_41190 [Clostridium butyricum]
MIINLEDVKREKEFKKRYILRKPLIKIMVEYREKYGVNMLEKDFNGIIQAMKQEKNCN